MKPTNGQGQSGPALLLDEEQLNTDEAAIWKSIRRRKRMTLADMVALFGSNDRASLRARNALRRLVRGGFVVRVDRGEFKPGTPNASKRRSSAEIVARKGSPRKKSKGKAKAKKVRAAKRTKTKRAAPKLAAKAAAAPAGSTPVASIGEEVKRLFPELAADSSGFRDALVVVAAHRLDNLSSTMIANATGLSRGYVIRRVNRLADLMLELRGRNELSANDVNTVLMRMAA